MTEQNRLVAADHWRSVDIPRILLQGMGAAFFIQVAGTGVGYIAQVLLARWIGVEEYGSYTFVLTWAQTFAVLALMGFDIAVVRFLPGYLVRNELAHLRGLIRWSRLLALGMGILLSVGTMLVSLVFRWVPVELSVLLLGALLIPVLSLSEIQTQIIRSKPKIALAYGPPVLIQPLVFLGGAVFVIAIWKILTAPLAVVTLGFSFLAVTAIQGWVIDREYVRKVRPTPAGYEISKWLRVTFPLLLISFFSIVLLRMDTLMVGFLLGVEEVGIYGAAFKTASIISFAMAATNAIVAPMIASWYERKETEGLQKIVGLATLGGFGLAVLLGIAVLLLSGFFLRAFGEEFLRAQSTLGILILGQVINVGAGPVGILLMMTGHERDTVRVLGWSVVINFLLCWLLIPHWGITGAALTSTIGMAVWNIWLGLLVNKKLGIRPSILFTVRRYVFRR